MALNTIRIAASDHPVTSVTVLKSSKAEVSRKFNISLKEGRNKLVITKLPTTIDVQSVRLSLLNPDGTPSEDTLLSDTVCSTADNPGDDPSKNRLRALEIKRSGLQSEKKMLDTQAEVMVGYARSLTEQFTGTKDIDTFMDGFSNRARTNIEASMKLEEQMAELDGQIQEERRKRALVKGTVNTELGIVIAADGNSRIQLNLTYVVNNTKWTPSYELHAVTGEDGKPSRKVFLHYHASIKQVTGEDWTDASLTLSTVAADAIVKRIPIVEPIKIHRVMPPSSVLPPPSGPPPIIIHSRSHSISPLHYSMRHSRSPSPARVMVPVQQSINPSDRPDSFRIPPDFRASQEMTPDDVLALSDDEVLLPEEEYGARGRRRDLPTKLVTQTPMTLNYAVLGKADIPSDGKEHTVTIAILTFDTDVEYVSVPRVDPRVFLQCKVKNDSEYRLLPGPVSVILDNSYVSRTNFSDVNRNDTFTFTLGDDPSMIISYERLSTVAKEGTRTFAESIDITTYTTTVTAQNTHPFSIENLAIRDAVPISERDNRIKVLLRKPEELVEAKEDEFVEVRGSGNMDDADSRLLVKWEKEKEGLYEYRWKVGANDTVKFETVFDVKAPSDLGYMFSNFGIHGRV